MTDEPHLCSRQAIEATSFHASRRHFLRAACVAGMTGSFAGEALAASGPQPKNRSLESPRAGLTGHDPRIICWSWGPTMPQAKSCRGTAVVGDVIVTVGGTWWEHTASGKSIKHWGSAVYELDTRKLQWKNLLPYPVPLGYPFVASIERRLYVIGGRNEDRGIAESFILDLSASERRWVPGPSLPSPRWAMPGGIVNGVIYLAGGIGGNPSQSNETQLAETVLAFDPRQPTKGWQEVAHLPKHSTEWAMSAACGGKLYLFGGLVATPQVDHGLMPQSSVFAFDVSKRTWGQCCPLPNPMGSGAAVAINSRFVLMTGGYSLAVPTALAPDGKARTYYTAECLLYDTVRDSYRSLMPLRIATCDQGFAFVGNRIFSFGGEDSPYGTRTDTVQVGVFY